MTAQARMLPIEVEQSHDIYRPGEQVAPDHDHSGRIVCAVLVVMPGVRADLVATADKAFVRGRVSGVIMSNETVVGPTGTVVGRIKGDTVKVAGRVNGLVHGRTLGCANGSRVEGEVVVDRLERQLGAVMVATVAVGPGMSTRHDLVDAAMHRLFPVPHEEAPGILPISEIDDDDLSFAPVPASDPFTMMLPPRAAELVEAVATVPPEPVVHDGGDVIPFPYLVR